MQTYYTLMLGFYTNDACPGIQHLYQLIVDTSLLPCAMYELPYGSLWCCISLGASGMKHSRVFSLPLHTNPPIQPQFALTLTVLYNNLNQCHLQILQPNMCSSTDVPGWGSLIPSMFRKEDSQFCRVQLIYYAILRDLEVFGH